VYMIALQLKQGRAEVENEYTRVVHQEGNPTALRTMKEAFEASDVPWRGFSMIRSSGLTIRKKLDAHDARKKFEDVLRPIHEREFSEAKGCRCGEMLRGVLTSEECPLFGKKCTPSTPVGPCMVSKEGSCYISYRYRKR